MKILVVDAEHEDANKRKIHSAISTLSRLQIQLMHAGISSTDYNDISEMIGGIKERLANID